MSEEWITFSEAVEIVRAHLGASIGRSEAVTKAARTSGEVRFQNRAGPVLLMADDGLVGMDMRPGAQDKVGITADGKPIVHRTTSTSMFQISKDDLLDWLGRQAPQQPTPKTTAPASVRPNLTKVGAPERYDWDEIEQFVAKQLNEKGDYELAENKVTGWRTRADLIELTKDHLQKLKMDVPGDTQMKAKIGEFVERWRSIQKVGN
jgi:hypothetical protein